MTVPLKAWIDHEGKLLRLRLNRPRANLIDAEMIAGLADVFGRYGGNVELCGVVLDSEGSEKRSFSLLEAYESSQFADVWRRTGRRSGDIFHTNSIEILDGSAADANPAFEAGNLLISVLHLNAIAVVDPIDECIRPAELRVWSVQEAAVRLHHRAARGGGCRHPCDRQGISVHVRVVVQQTGACPD